MAPRSVPLLACLENRLQLASSRLPKPSGAGVRQIEIVAPAGVQWHLDDRNWPSARPPADAATITVRCLAGAATFIAAPGADRTAAP